MSVRLISLLGFIFTFLFLVSCKPYNSDEVNNQMIQGKWQLVAVESKRNDSASLDLNQQDVYLYFNGNKCTQEIVGLVKSDYTFIIHNFTLMLYKDSVFDNKLDIYTLTVDSLIFKQGGDRSLKYKRTGL